MPKALTVPAAWEASHDGQVGLEGRTPEIRRQNYTKLVSCRDDAYGQEVHFGSLMELCCTKSAQKLDPLCRTLFGGLTLLKRPDRSNY